jgi:hypothetical protein
MKPLSTRTPRIIERRKHQRSVLPPGSLISFSPIATPADVALEAEGEGMVIDISPGGCRVSSDITLAFEQPYSLIIQLPDFPQPVTVESAIARWKGKHTFGVMFIAMQPEQEQSLTEFIEYLRSDAA